MNSVFRILHPITVFIAGWVTWWVVFFLAPYGDIDGNFYFKHKAFPLLIKFSLMFLLGIIVALFLVRKKNIRFNQNISVDKLVKPVILTLFIAMVADILQTIDLIFATGGAESFMEARENFRAQAAASIFPSSVWSAIFLLFKVSSFPIFIALVFINDFKSRYPWLFFWSLVVSLYPLLNMIAFGKKAFMIITLGIYIWFALYFGLFKNKKNAVKILIVMIILFILSGAGFAYRSGSALAFLVTVTAEYNMAENVQPSEKFVEDVEEKIARKDRIGYGLRLGGMVFAQYYNHGIFEFFHLYDWKPKNLNNNGTATLSMFYKVLAGVGLLQSIEYYRESDSIIDNKNWVFDSFYGGQLKDWGEDNAYYSFFFIGMFFALLYRLAQSSIFAFPLYAVTSNVIFFIPVTDLIYNGQYWHYFTLSLVFYLYMEFVAGRTKRRNMH